MKKILAQTFLIIFLGLLVCPKLIKADTPLFIEKKDMDSNGSHATLSLENTTVKLEELFAVNVCFYNQSGSELAFFNPYFNGLLSSPAQLAVFDSQKKYVGDLIQFIGGSQAMMTPKDWVLIPQSGFVSTSLKVKLHRVVSAVIPFELSKAVPPGDYYLQMIYSKTFILDVIPSPEDKAASEEWERKFRGSGVELFRSNPVKITVVGQ